MTIYKVSWGYFGEGPSDEYYFTDVDEAASTYIELVNMCQSFGETFPTMYSDGKYPVTWTHIKEITVGGAEQDQPKGETANLSTTTEHKTQRWATDKTLGDWLIAGGDKQYPSIELRRHTKDGTTFLIFHALGHGSLLYWHRFMENQKCEIADNFLRALTRADELAESHGGWAEILDAELAQPVQLDEI